MASEHTPRACAVAPDSLGFPARGNWPGAPFPPVPGSFIQEGKEDWEMSEVENYANAMLTKLTEIDDTIASLTKDRVAVVAELGHYLAGADKVRQALSHLDGGAAVRRKRRAKAETVPLEPPPVLEAVEKPAEDPGEVPPFLRRTAS